MTGAKAEPVENNYTGCQQLHRLLQHTPMLQQTAQHAQIPHKIKVKVKRNPQSATCLLNRCLLEHQHTSIPCPLPMLRQAQQHNREHILNLLHLN